jgi:hypothetical protein
LVVNLKMIWRLLMAKGLAPWREGTPNPRNGNAFGDDIGDRKGCQNSPKSILTAKQENVESGMRTTIDLPDSLFREAKTRAVQHGVKFKDLVAQYIEAGLRGRSSITDTAQREVVPLPMFRGSNGPAIPSRTNAELFEILEREETDARQP